VEDDGWRHCPTGRPRRSRDADPPGNDGKSGKNGDLGDVDGKIRGKWTEETLGNSDEIMVNIT
jgi:hypothetical protein